LSDNYRSKDGILNICKVTILYLLVTVCASLLCLNQLDIDAIIKLLLPFHQQTTKVIMNQKSIFSLTLLRSISKKDI